jgi:hypothetical protein
MGQRQATVFAMEYDDSNYDGCRVTVLFCLKGFRFRVAFQEHINIILPCNDIANISVT